MKYFSEAYFRNIAYSTPLYEQRTYSDNLQGASLYKQFDIFLSYNISDLGVFFEKDHPFFSRYARISAGMESLASNLSLSIGFAVKERGFLPSPDSFYRRNLE